MGVEGERGARELIQAVHKRGSYSLLSQMFPAKDDSLMQHPCHFHEQGQEKSLPGADSRGQYPAHCEMKTIRKRGVSFPIAFQSRRVPGPTSRPDTQAQWAAVSQGET